MNVENTIDDYFQPIWDCLSHYLSLLIHYYPSPIYQYALSTINHYPLITIIPSKLALSNQSQGQVTEPAEAIGVSSLAPFHEGPGRQLKLTRPGQRLQFAIENGHL